MIRFSIATLLGLSVFLPPGVCGAQDVSELLSHQAPVDAPNGGLVRLSLTPEALSLAAPDLSDVRIETSYGTYLPYVVDREDHPRETLVDEVRAELTPTSATQTRTRGPVSPIFREVYQVGLPPAAGRSVTTLELTTDVPEFTATVHVTGVGVDVSATVFRISRMAVSRLEVPLPDDTMGPVTVAIEGETGFLSPHLYVRTRAFETAFPRLSRPLEITASRMEGTTQVIELARPAGLLPLHLRIATSSTTFASAVTVQVRSASDGLVSMGSGAVYRIPPRVEGSPGAEQLVIPVSGWLPGDQLIVRLERGDSPPLEGLEVIAELCEVALAFESQPDLVLRFGGARLRAPAYDLAMLGSALRDPNLPRATLGPVIENPRYRHDPILSFAMRAGAEVDRSTFRTSATVTLPEAREGLTRVALTPAFIAAARSDRADIRVLSEDGRQWPYLLSGDPRDVTLEVPVHRTADPERPGTSRYELELPFSPLVPARIDVNPTEGFFGRSFEMSGVLEGQEDAIYAGEAYGERASGATASVQVWVSENRYQALSLLISDGSEAPLSFDTVTVHVNVVDLLVTAPAGTYQILCGDELATAPTYDLGRVSEDLLRNVSLETVALGAVGPNPAFHEPTFFERSGWQTMVLWAVLVISVLGLLVLTLRLARNEPAAETKPEPAAATMADASPSDPAEPAGTAKPAEAESDEAKDPAEPEPENEDA